MAELERPLVAMVGGDTLLAREIRELLGESRPVPRVQLISAAADGTTPLHWAAFHGDAEMARLLIQAGANLKLATRVGGITPLMLASQNGNGEVVEVLLKAGADANSVTPDGTTVLMAACLRTAARARGIGLSLGQIHERTGASDVQPVDRFSQARRFRLPGRLSSLACGGPFIYETTGRRTPSQGSCRWFNGIAQSAVSRG